MASEKAPTATQISTSTAGRQPREVSWEELEELAKKHGPLKARWMVGGVDLLSPDTTDEQAREGISRAFPKDE